MLHLSGLMTNPKHWYLCIFVFLFASELLHLKLQSPGWLLWDPWCEGCSRLINPGHFWYGQELGHKTNSMSSLCTSNKNYKKILFSLTLTFRRKHKKSSNISFLEQREQRYNQDKWLFPTFWQKGNRTLNIHFLICQWSIPIDRLFTSVFHSNTSKLFSLPSYFSPLHWLDNGYLHTLQLVLIQIDYSKSTIEISLKTCCLLSNTRK